jgi:hypothetical protein
MTSPTTGLDEYSSSAQRAREVVTADITRSQCCEQAVVLGSRLHLPCFE